MQLELFDWQDKKQCNTCSEVKSMDSFYNSKLNTNGKINKCITCYNAYHKKKYYENHEYRLKQQSDRCKNNLDKNRARNAKRRARKLNATPKWLTKQQNQAIIEVYKEAKRLEELTGNTYHVDHIVPLINKNVCGLHVPWNLQVLSASENMSKSNKFIQECFT